MGVLDFSIACIVIFGRLAIVETTPRSGSRPASVRPVNVSGAAVGAKLVSLLVPGWRRSVQGRKRDIPEVNFGQIVVVYYDAANPRMNSLVDFSVKSRKHARFVYIFLLVLAAGGSFILWNEGTRVALDERTG